MLTMFLRAIVIDFVQIVISSFVLKVLWGWYVVTTFGLPPLSIAQSAGVGVIMGLLTVQHIPRDDEARKEMTIFNLSIPFVMLAFGWILHFFL